MWNEMSHQTAAIARHNKVSMIIITIIMKTATFKNAVSNVAENVALVLPLPAQDASLNASLDCCVHVEIEKDFIEKLRSFLKIFIISTLTC